MARNTTPRPEKPFGQPRLLSDHQVKSNGQQPDTDPDSKDEKRQQTLSFVAFTDSKNSAGMGYWVPCPLPAYHGVSVLFRTNNSVRLRHTRPSHYMPFEIRKLLRDEGKLLTRIQEEAASDAGISDETDLELEAVRRSIVSKRAAYEDAYNLEQAEWLSSYVLDIAPWPMKDIEKPDPADPKSYHVLYTHLSDLYFWVLDEGYTAALEESAKNS